MKLKRSTFFGPPGSIDNNPINRHIDIPPAFLQLKHPSDKNKYFRQPPAINDSTPEIQDYPTMTTHPTTTNQTLQPTKEPIRRSRRIQQQKQTTVAVINVVQINYISIHVM